FQIWRAFDVEFTNNGKPPNLKSVTPKSSTRRFSKARRIHDIARNSKGLRPSGSRFPVMWAN
ncbi:MAG: hypothetical protein O3A00_22720, partial [Planctomycetota bacterium]|nr:hypothetical protein [Planctomycetota bacterium]